MNNDTKGGRILVTGGAGYIGSHCCLELLNQGYEVVVVDNLLNASSESLDRVSALTGRAIEFHQVDLLDVDALEAVFVTAPVEAVIHFAALKAVGESVQRPLDYYHNNLTGTLNLLQRMAAHGVYRLVYSSSATVYGDNNPIPYREEFPLSATSPYGRTKVMCEQILQDLARADDNWRIFSLRYFNPVGAHPSGMIGEDPAGIPNNLVPFITQVAVGRRDCLTVFGNDYPTVDGTGVRDYIHVVDLADGHLRALAYLADQRVGFETCNLGAGKGYSVLEVIKAFERSSGRPIPYRIEARRAGDIAEFFADASRAERLLGWHATRDIDVMCADAWNWQCKNPNGYADQSPSSLG